MYYWLSSRSVVSNFALITSSDDGPAELPAVDKRIKYRVSFVQIYQCAYINFTMSYKSKMITREASKTRFYKLPAEVSEILT